MALEEDVVADLTINHAVCLEGNIGGVKLSFLVKRS